MCLRIHRGIEKHNTDVDWLSERAAKAFRFFERDLRPHFEVEEEIVFPAMRGIAGAVATVEQLIEKHRKIERLVHRLHTARGLQMSPLFREFANLLEAHIRKEERVPFPCYERNISPKEAGQVKIQILEAIGTA